MTQPLFRPEVLEAKRGSWLGGISLALQEQERAQTKVRGARMVKAPATGVAATPVVKPGQAITARGRTEALKQGLLLDTDTVRGSES